MNKPTQGPLTPGWVLRPLGEIMRLDAEQTSPADECFAHLPFLGLENIESNTRQFIVSPESNETGRSACWRFGPQHVLYGKLRPYLNKVLLPDHEGRCSLEILPLLPQPGFGRDFVAAVLQTPSVVSFATKHSTGGRMPRADVRKLMKFSVETSSDVRRCNQMGETLSARLQYLIAMRRAAQRQLEASESLTQSHLANIFPFQNLAEIPAGWSVERLRDLSRSIDYGLSLSASKQPRGPKFVRITDIQDGKVNWDAVPYCDCRAEDAVSAKLQDGDILFARTGATTGKSFLILNPPTAVFASYLIRVQCRLDRVSPDYLYAFFQSKLYWQVINKGARGGAQAGFNATMLGDVCVPLPASKDEQAGIAASFQKVDQTARAIRLGCERQLDAISALPAATLRQFFNFGTRADG